MVTLTEMSRTEPPLLVFCMFPLRSRLRNNANGSNGSRTVSLLTSLPNDTLIRTLTRTCSKQILSFISANTSISTTTYKLIAPFGA